MKLVHLLAIVIATYCLSCTELKQADVIIHNAHIYTVDDQFSEAEAIAIKDGRVVAIGAEHQILNAYSATEVIDAKQGVLYPGFIDAHAHFIGYGIELQRLNLVGTTSFEEVIQRIKDYTETVDHPWVLGRGWDQNDWIDKSFPNTDTLAALFPNHFIALKRVDGHAFLVSPNVLNLAGITADTKVNGGRIIVQNEQLTGILIDEAMELVNAVIPKPDVDFKTHAIELAEQNCFEAGLTTVCDAGLSVEDVELLNRLHQNGLNIRVYAMYAADDDLLHNLSDHFLVTDRLTARSVKVYADGALGSRGAKLLEPYSDDLGNSGILITPGDSILKWAIACYQSNFQLNVHCIGDGANRMVLDTMGRVLKTTNDRRWRIEHAQVVHPKDQSKFGRFNILPSMQPTHATSDMYWAEERLGANRLASAYAIRSLMLENGMIPLGTDFPVEGISPIATFFAAIARKDREGFPEGGFQANECLSREEALRGITIWAAIANFEDENRGSLEVGKFADMVLLDQDLIRCPEQAILKASVIKTWVNGTLVYERG
jgi:predicted amidohydrolase YtcJ